MPQIDRPVNSAVQPCKVLHDFDLVLKPAPDERPRPAWWPTERRSAYPSEAITITLPGVSPARQKLDGSGAFHAGEIPPGQAQVTFHDFYSSVLEAFRREAKYPK